MRITPFIATVLTVACSSALAQVAPPAQPAATPASAVHRPDRGLEVLMCSAMAPCTIHVKATVDEKALFTRYAWDFGDPDSRHNNLVGFNAAHFYQRPGKYTITLTRSNDEGVKKFTINLEIAPDRRKKFFVSRTGSDANDGISEATAFRTAERASKAVTDDCGIYFKRGDVFDMGSALVIDKTNVLVSAYGETDQPAPVLRKAAEGLQELIRTREKAADVVVRDLCFDSAYGDNPDKRGAARGIWAAGTNITGHNLEFRNVSDAVNAELKPRGVLIEDSRCPLPTSLRSYFLWGQGEDLVVLNNSAPNSTREHSIRLGGAQRVLVAYNDFANIDRRKEGDKDDIAKGCLVFQEGAYIYAAHNTLRGGGTGVGPLGGRDGVKSAAARMKWVVIESNRVEQAGMGPSAGAEHVVFRNNILKVDDSIAFNVRPTDETKADNGTMAYADRTMTDVWFVHNTVINNGTNGRFVNFDAPAVPGAVTLIGNLYVAPKWETGHNQNAGVMLIKTTDLSGFAAIGQNVWPVPAKSNPAGAIHYVFPEWFSEAGYLTLARWHEKSPVVKGDVSLAVRADDQGVPAGEHRAAIRIVPPVPGVEVDANEKPRPAGLRSAGAVEVE